MSQLATTPVRVDQPVSPPASAHPGAASLDDVFANKEWHELHAQDQLAGSAIVAIMIAIFSLGLIGYTVIALVCASS